ncbi:hypothetical protein CK446_004953 [Salmonella enterica subsp. enterica serovar Copenhagen]|nr:hypothetical protein [Salmonella enterica]ECU0144833.1 hypothetical protein [Salmonella enterica subsp. enterica serovar Typhimurium]EDW9276247.1 hypothetical protein [Salmonella enterica subsp. enterica serovar Copenhagen]ECH4722866.1 hypothetical protein [Salmonella enterica]ECI9550384.1 hypothetical protein [Salmonella enterica]
MLTAERDFMQQRLYFTGIIYQLICCAMILLLPKGTSFYGVCPILHRTGTRTAANSTLHSYSSILRCLMLRLLHTTR